MTRWTTAADLHDLGPGTTLVTGPGSNWLVLRDGESCTPIDCGHPNDRDLVDASIEAAGLGGLPGAVLVTHAHGDHIGTLGRYIAAGVPVHISAAEFPDITGTSREQIGPTEPLPRAVLSPGRAKWCLHALDVPGAPRPEATTGHTSYLIGDTGVLASGDAVVTGRLTSRHVGAPQVLADPFHHDLPEALLTAVRLLSEAEFDVLAPGPRPGAARSGRPAIR
ncbi:MBL fold metallo-hydrolase [Kocuria sabuli]|uniref:MBL fold metallo-hydrolase n=1 Tax=Kocuria sabuli TaxID=3071448 RepID=UPI0034D4A46F